MARPLIVTQLHEILNAMVPRHRKDRRSRVSRIPVAESLECRGLMSITASGVISSTPDGSNYNYTIQLTNSSSSTSGIGTFWYAWVPGEEFLATSPISVSPPTGWTDQITHAGAGDGYAIRFEASSSSYDVQPGSPLNFGFTSANTPALA